jgi:hypothetical protein
MYQFTLIDELWAGNSWPQQIVLNNLPGTDPKYKVPPAGWEKMTYTFTRNGKYYGLFPKFSAALGFTRDAKSWIDNLFWTYGLNAQISISITTFNPQTQQYQPFISGIGNIENLISKQFRTNLEIIESLFYQDILNKDSVELDYQKMVDTYSVDHTSDSTWIVPPLEHLLIKGTSSTTATAWSVYPFQLFQQLIGLMTGNQQAFHSAFFGKITDKDENGNYYAENGPGALIMITTGRFIRGYNYGIIKVGQGRISCVAGSATITGILTSFLSSGLLAIGDYLKDDAGNLLGVILSITNDTTLVLQTGSFFTYSGYWTYQSKSDNSTLIITFEKLFKAFSSIFSLAMTIKVDKYNSPYVEVEPLQNYYNNQVICEITDPKDIEISLDKDWRYNEIEVGYSKSQKNENNNYGNSEYNNKVTYTSPTRFTKNKLTIISDIRTDGTGLQLCIDNPKGSGDDTSQNQFDTEIFMVSSIVLDGVLQSRNNYNISVIANSLYGSNNPELNLDLAPARMLEAWLPMVKPNLMQENDLILQFQKAETLSTLSTMLSTEGTPVSECVDIPVSSMPDGFLSGYEANMTAPLGIVEVFAMQNNPYGLVKFYNVIIKAYQYGWVKEWSTDPIDKTTNLKLALISSNVEPLKLEYKLLLLNRKYMRLLNGGELLLINQN